MTSLKEALNLAAAKGIIHAEQVAPLTGHLLGHGIGRSEDLPLAPDLGLSAPRDGNPSVPGEESEAPRFVRGFHDVLITVGIIVALSGLAAVGTVFALIPAIIVLAEILVKRQRLALPAFALAVAFVVAIVSIVVMLFGGYESSGTVAQMVAIYAACAAALTPFYWRYRVPVSLAALFLSGIGLAYFIAMQVLGVGTVEEVVTSGVSRITAFLFSIAAFCVAMWFDMGDRMRVTQQSDVAFWLHLGTAPALLNSALALSLWQSGGVAFWTQSLTGPQASIAIAVLALFMLIGVIIDRRAFVTAGILSLGYALSALIKTSSIGFGADNLFGYSALAVGIIILTLGIGWQPIRARVLGVLPSAIRTRVPPVKA